MKKYIKINKNDNVAIVLEPMKKGEIIIEYKKPPHTQVIITKVIDTIIFKFFEITSNI